jgi:hypothetical protein
MASMYSCSLSMFSGVASHIQAAHGEALFIELVDGVVEDDGVLEPGVAFRDQDGSVMPSATMP